MLGTPAVVRTDSRVTDPGDGDGLIDWLCESDRRGGPGIGLIGDQREHVGDKRRIQSGIIMIFSGGCHIDLFEVFSLQGLKHVNCCGFIGCGRHKTQICVCVTLGITGILSDCSRFWYFELFSRGSRQL